MSAEMEEGKMAEEPELYGRPIVASARLTLAGQVRDILSDEIHAGRWEVGERLPSLSDLVRMTGLSQGTVRAALKQLQQEGYIRREERKGTFLTSQSPTKGASRGSLGIVLPVQHDVFTPSIAAYRLWTLHWIGEEAVKRGFTTEVHSVRDEQSCRGVDTTKGPFGHRVKGIVSLSPFPRPAPDVLEPDQIPMVFAYIGEEYSSPRVHPDNSGMMYQLTRTVLSRGHRRAAYCDSPHMARSIGRARLRGFKRAMEEKGFETGEDSADRSRPIRNGDFEGFRNFLAACGDVTAIVCAGPQRAQNLVAVCDRVGVRVPEDLSIVAFDSDYVRPHAQEERLTGMDPAAESIAETALDLLETQMRTRRCPVTNVGVAGRFVEGTTLGPPREVDVEVASKLERFPQEVGAR